MPNRFAILFVAALTLGSAMIDREATASDQRQPLTFAIAVHGGAGRWANRTDEDAQEVLATIDQALRRGRDRLAAGGTSLDAVEQTIRFMEDSPLFNAGKGATFNAAGRHELDASIMRGEDLAAGAVAAVTVAKNPITLARRVMTDTKHVLLIGEGADQFARQSGVEIVTDDYFWTERTRAEWHSSQRPKTDESRSGAASPGRRDVDHYGTVGCVALDQHGNLAAGTSTGGLTRKQVGRVGDSPLIGAGTYADNRACAVSGTGVGELFIRHAVAYDVAARVRYQKASLKDAVEAQFDKRLPADTGGLIALSPSGEFAAAFNTTAMPRGVADSSGRFETHFERNE